MTVRFLTCDGSAPVVPPATSAESGAPGMFSPWGSALPANLAAMSGITADPSTPWTTGQYVVLGDGSQAYWNGTAWRAGKAPAPVRLLLDLGGPYVGDDENDLLKAGGEAFVYETTLTNEGGDLGEVTETITFTADGITFADGDLTVETEDQGSWAPLSLTAVDGGLQNVQQFPIPADLDATSRNRIATSRDDLGGVLITQTSVITNGDGDELTSASTTFLPVEPDLPPDLGGLDLGTLNATADTSAVWNVHIDNTGGDLRDGHLWLNTIGPADPVLTAADIHVSGVAADSTPLNFNPTDDGAGTVGWTSGSFDVLAGESVDFIVTFDVQTAFVGDVSLYGSVQDNSGGEWLAVTGALHVTAV